MSSFRKTHESNWIWVLTGTVVGCGLTAGWSYHHHRAQTAEVPAAVGAYCDNGIGAAKGSRAGGAREGEYHPFDPRFN